MKLIAVILFAACLQVSARGYSQITLSENNAPLQKVFKEIQKQSGYDFVCTYEILKEAGKVSVNVRDVSLQKALEECLKGKSLTYVIIGKTVVVQSKEKDYFNTTNIIVPEILPPPPIEIHGRVVNQQGQPLQNVSVLISGTKIGTTTDNEGRFTLTASDDKNIVLEISSVGYQAKKVSVGKQTEINVVLEVDVAGLSDVVVVGYGTSKRRDVTGAISSIDAEQISQRSPTNAFEAMQGQIAGVQITTPSGAPGSGAAVRIRGVSTFEGGSTPLFILDGGPVDNIDNINPNDIKSIEVLKDGASAAIYGSRSANGVIIITTKSGQIGKTTFNVNYTHGFNTARIMPVATTNQRILYEQFQGNMPTPNLDTLNQMFYINNNFQSLMYRTAQRDQFNISLSSGSKNSKLYWNTGLENQEGVIRTTKFMRINSRLNIDQNVTERIKLGTRVNLSYSLQKNVSQDIDNDLIGQALLTKPAFSALFDADGSYLNNTNNYRGMPNPIREYDLMDVKDGELRGNIFNFMEVKIIKGLKYTANFGIDYNYSRNTQFFPEYVHSMLPNITSTFKSSLAWNWLHESFFNYDRVWREHKIGAILGVSLQKWSAPHEQISGYLANSLLPTLNNALQLLPNDTYTKNENDHSLASAFVRLNYSYKEKYLLSGTLRRDGSSRFGTDNKWGNFPSLSAGWRLTEEPFMQNLKFINDLKLRVSYAVTGNEHIGNRDFDELLTIGNFYNGINGTGLSSQLANSSIQWEETKQKNFGLDIAFLDQKLKFTFDYYIKETNDLLASQPLPAQTGLDFMRVNVGNVQNKGFELSIHAVPYETKDFRWNMDYNFSTNTNKVLKMAGGVPIISDNNITETGRSLGSFYGYKILGVFAYDQSNAFSSDGKRLTPNFNNGQFVNYTSDGKAYSGDVKRVTVGGIIPKGGDFYWNDLNGDFKIDGQDRQILGNPYPKYFGGFRNEIFYKHFSFSFLFGYQFGVQVYNQFMQWGSQLRANAQTPPPYVLANFWTGPGDEGALFPGGVKRNQNQLGVDGTPTSNWVENADFIKLSNVKLSFDFPSKIINKIGLKNLMIYSSVNNPFVWTNYMGADPEVNGDANNPIEAGIDDGRYPRTRELLIGINVNF